MLALSGENYANISTDDDDKQKSSRPRGICLFQLFFFCFAKTDFPTFFLTHMNFFIYCVPSFPFSAYGLSDITVLFW